MPAMVEGPRREWIDEATSVVLGAWVEQDDSALSWPGPRVGLFAREGLVSWLSGDGGGEATTGQRKGMSTR